MLNIEKVAFLYDHRVKMPQRLLFSMDALQSLVMDTRMIVRFKVYLKV